MLYYTSLSKSKIIKIKMKLKIKVNFLDVVKYYFLFCKEVAYWLQSFLREQRIIYKTSTLYIHQQNDCAE